VEERLIQLAFYTLGVLGIMWATIAIVSRIIIAMIRFHAWYSRLVIRGLNHLFATKSARRNKEKSV
jgi:hypothetical protein